MSDELKFRVDVDADVSGQAQVDGLAASVDRLGTESRQAGVDAKAAGVSLDGVGDAAQRAESKAVPAQEKIRDSAHQITRELRLLAGAYASLQGGSALADAAVDLAKVADAAKNLHARLALVVGEGPQLQAALAGVEAVALRTHSALEATSTLFGKIVDSGKAINLGTAEALALTETINQAIQISGASAQASNDAILQLVQGLQSGVVRGDEFNSIMEQAPRLAKAMADGLGVTTGGLREMAEAGALTSQTVIAALQGQARTIDAEFAKLPKTIGRAITDLTTHWETFISQTDEASGASAKVAEVIETVARNLDLIAGALINSGQAWLAWKAYGIVAEFLGLRAAVLSAATATGVATAATIANTAATAANTTAQAANTAARAGAAAGVLDLSAVAGKLSGVLSLLKGFSLAFLLTNLKDVGDWIAKTAFGMTDLAKRTAELERSEANVAEVQRRMALATAEDAAKKQMAADAAFGLSKRSRELVADFEEQIKKGGAATEAIDKLAKALNLTSGKGINDAGAALDDLERKGLATADEVSQAWAKALSGKDLRVFAFEAQAAFDDTEQGQRRLAAAMEAVLGEAIRRTGKDLGELSTGISRPAQSAINDYDTLLARLDEIRAKGLDVGATLAASLDQAEKAANTEAAMAAVVERWEELGKQGLVAGERLRKGLEGARAKLDELKPGINSVSEAFKALGVKSQEELKRTAETAKQAFETILHSGTATPAQLAAAFKKYAAAVLDANGGVVTDTLRIQAAMRGLTIEVDGTGKAIITAMGSGVTETDRFANSVDRATGKVKALREASERPSPHLTGSVKGKVSRDGDISADINVRDESRELSPEQLRDLNYTASQIADYYAKRATSKADQAAGLINRPVNTITVQNEEIGRQAGLTGPAVKVFAEQFGDLLADELATMRRKLLDVAAIDTEGYLREYSGAFERAKQIAVANARSAVGGTVAPPEPASVHRVEITIGSKKTAVDTASPDAAASLIRTLKGLQERAA